MFEKLKYDYNPIYGDIIEIKIRNGRTLVYKVKCNLNNGKELKKIFDYIKLKYNLDIIEEIRENSSKNWFEE